MYIYISRIVDIFHFKKVFHKIIILLYKCNYFEYCFINATIYKAISNLYITVSLSNFLPLIIRRNQGMRYTTIQTQNYSIAF